MKETMMQTKATYTLEYKGKFFLIEHVPARVCRKTLEHIQAVIKGGKKPAKTIETPVYKYA